MEFKNIDYRTYKSYREGFETEDYTITITFEEGWLNYVNIEHKRNESGLFIFDPSNEQHLELAAKIHERVCELKREYRQESQPPSSKASGKLK